MINLNVLPANARGHPNLFGKIAKVLKDAGHLTPLSPGQRRTLELKRSFAAPPRLQLLTWLRHRLCAAAKALMPVSNPIKVPFEQG
jgi:hypothetical protein